jgi:amino acid adenylation domain-containing protein
MTVSADGPSAGERGAHAAPISVDRRVVHASVGQASLWFLRQVMPYKSPYNTAVQFRLVGELDPGVLVAAIREIARRHESCRTTFDAVDGTVVQIIHGTMPVDVAIVDVASAGDPEAEATRVARAVASDPFDLERGPLVRARVVRIGPRDHALVVVMDHIVADGMSLAVIWRELEALYPALRAGEASPLPPPKKQYVECVDAQNRWLASPAFAKHLDFWKGHLAGAAPCDLPTDRPRPPIKSYRGATARTRIPRTLVAKLDALTRADGVSLFASVLAALEVLLARYSGQRDISVLVPVACRSRFRAEEVIGYFANVLVLRNDVPADVPFRTLLKSVNAEVLAGLLRQDVPFERVIEAIRPERSLSHDPLASVGLSFLPAGGSRLNLPGVIATYEEISNGGSKFDLHLFMADVAGDLTVTTEYNTDIYDRETIERLNEHYVVLLEAIANDPSATIGSLPLMAPAEQRRVLVDWNGTEAPFPSDKTIPALVTDTAKTRPDAVAVTFEGQALRYAELDRRSNQVARCLADLGVAPGTLVGIALERSLDMVVGLLGILKAGAAYVPLDPAYPRDRLALMASDSGLSVLLTEQRFSDIVSSPAVLRMDADRARISAQSDAPVDVAIAPEALAYVIYTSGSTGKPKGVEIPHRAVVNFLASMALRPGLSERDCLLAVTSLSFDIAGLELWLPLMVGAHIELASRATASNGAALKALVESGDVTVLQATPSTYRLMLEAGWRRTSKLKVLIGGEATPRELADQLLERAASVWNMYGPTETTIWSCVHELERGAPVLIGRPIANTQVYVLDRHLQPVPPGVTGEIHIAGDGVARGYLGRPELTRERFLPDPFSQQPGARMYRTGDLGRLRPDGALDYLGRNDFQVKLRGYRIELGEIEANLATHPAVREAVVVAYEEAPGDQRLVAYFTSDSPPAFDDLRAHLRAKLPDYMVPARFMVLDRLPLTANNKIDRKALPKPDRATAPGTSRARAMPREAVEFKLRAIWEELLQQTGIGTDDNFFDLGGHSLLALKLFDRVQAAFGIQLPIAALFQAPTIEKLAGLLRREGWQPSWSSLVPIQTSGSKRPLFCVHAIGGNVLNYRLLSRCLGDDQPFYGLQARGLGGTEPPHTSVEEMATAYIREMKTVQPEGPYHLCGASSGGTVAFEIAQQLHASGERVGLLSFLDTHVPQPPPRSREALALSALHRAGMLLDWHLGELLLRSPRAGLGYLAERARARLDGINQPIERTMRSATPITQRVFEANMRAIHAYTPKTYPGSAVMLLSRDMPQRAAFDARLAWADLLLGGLNVRFVPADHETLLDEPVVQDVAQVLGRCLREAQGVDGA